MDQIGLVPGVPHLANLPLAALQRTGFLAAGAGHFMNRPLASLHRVVVAKAGVAATETAMKAINKLRIG